MSKLVDLLDEDKPIAGQKYVCLSFVSPEDILKNKNLFYFEKLLKHFDFKKLLQEINSKTVFVFQGAGNISSISKKIQEEYL